MTWKHRLRLMLRQLGFDVSRYNAHIGTPLDRRLKLMRNYGVNLVLDVGANTGQYARGLRNAGFRARVVSFEPLSSAFTALCGAAASDPSWTVHNIALGDRDGEAEINIAGNSQSSSLFEILPAHLNRTPQARTIGRETVKIRRLDSLLPDLLGVNDRPFLKLDAQGYERNIIAGASDRIHDFVGLQLELSLTPLYEGETLLASMILHMEDLGFTLMSLEPGFCDTRTGQLLQVDCCFFPSRASS